MASASEIETQIHGLIPLLSLDQQQQILDHVQSLLGQQGPSRKATGRDLVAALSGVWSKETADEIERIIEEDCERIDPEGW